MGYGALMKAYAVHVPQRLGYDILIELGNGEGDQRWFLDRDGVPQIVSMGSEAPRYMHIPEPVAKALGEVLNPSDPPATREHLEYAMDVGDRMMRLVENLWEAPR
jgi:hypothetical protein